MSNQNCTNNIFQNKTFNHKNLRRNFHTNSLLSGTYNIVYQNLKNSINTQCNLIELEFNNYCKSNKYINKTLVRNMKSVDFLDRKRNITKESERLSNINDNN